MSSCPFLQSSLFSGKINNFALPCLILLKTISLSHYAGFMNISNMTRLHILSLLLFSYLEGLSQSCQVFRYCSSFSMCSLFIVFVSHNVAISLLGEKTIRQYIHTFTILNAEWKYLTLISKSHFYQHINISFNIDYSLYRIPIL